jgi:Rrf2 family protein
MSARETILHVLTSKTRYGLKALVYLARQSGLEPTPIGEIARANAIPKKFLDAILLDLQRGGVLTARKGKGGGYLLARPADLIPIGQVVRLFDGPLAPLACASRSAYQPCADCPDPGSCVVRSVMSEARDALSSVLDGRTLAELAVFPEDYPEPISYCI